MKLSIITINRNNADGLEKTILSVIDQEFTNYEYIIIDGNSTDNSVEIIKEHSEYVSFWISEPDSGIYNAMNKGIKRATGEYVIFMNSGDCFFNNYSLKKIFSIEHLEDFLIGETIIDWKHFKEKMSIPSKLTSYFLMTEAVNHQATIIKRKLFDEIGYYDENLKICADWKFVLIAFVKYNKSIKKITEIIALMDVNGISSSKTSLPQKRREREETILTCFPHLYDDYKELYRLKRFTFYRLKKHIKWRFRNLIRNWEN